MNHPPRRPRWSPPSWLVSLLSALLLVAVPLLPIQAQNPAAGAKKKELLSTTPFDRLTLLDNTTWEIEPVAPRPLPPYDAKKARKIKVKSTEEIRLEGGNVGLDGQPIGKIATGEKDDEATILIHMVEGEIRDYQVKREHIKSVEYFEDLLLLEAERLTAAHDFTKAFEYLLYVQSRDPKWKGLQDRIDKLEYEEGSTALLDGDGERGLRLLGDLASRRPDFPNLSDKLANSYSARITKAYSIGTYAKGRLVLRELIALAPDHLATKEARDRFTNGSQELVAKAEAAKLPGERLDLLTEAARVWPSKEGLEAKYVEAFRADPTLEVGVADLPRPIAPWRRSGAAERVARLLYRPILAGTDEASIKGTAPGQLAEGIESFDLARGLRIRLKPGFAWSDGSRPVSAIDVARALADRAVSTAPGYSARWGDLLQKVEVTEANVVEVRLGRACLRPESWLVEPVGPAHAGWDGWVMLVGQGRRPIGDGPFTWQSSGKDIDLYRSASPTSKVRRLREIRYPTPSGAVAAFLRGETTLLEHVPSDRVREVAAQPEIQVGRFENASLHRIAIDGRNPSLRLRSLRRGLSLAIDRKTLLAETILKRPPDAENAVADGPFLKGTYADAPDVAPLAYDPLLAKMLITAAKTERGGGVLKLTLEYPPTAEARAVCPKLAEAWQLAGIALTLREVPQAELESKLRAGERFDLAYLATRPTDPALDAGLLICPAYDAPPSTDPLASVASARMLQLLLELDRAPEATASRTLAIEIDRETRDELPMLPLWQLQDHYAWRTRLKGPKPTAKHLYDNLENWEIEPWFAKDQL